MQISALPTPLEQLDARPFSFYPPILNVPHNEWIFRRATWSEIVVVNGVSGEEACIPRVFIGEISFDQDLTIRVALRRELRWKHGAVRTNNNVVIELPVARQDGVSRARQRGPLAPVISIRLETPRQKRPGRKVAVAVMLGSVACLLAADIARHMQPRQQLPQGAGGGRRAGLPAFPTPLTINSQHR